MLRPYKQHAQARAWHLAPAITVEAILLTQHSLERLRAFGTRCGVLLGFEEALFPAELVVTREALLLERSFFGGADGAAWLALVAAVAKATLLRKRSNVGK